MRFLRCARTGLASWAEAGAGVRYTDIEETDNVSFIGHVLLELNPNWGVNMEVDIGDEIGMYLLGVRYAFDRF